MTSLVSYNLFSTVPYGDRWDRRNNTCLLYTSLVSENHQPHTVIHGRGIMALIHSDTLCSRDPSAYSQHTIRSIQKGKLKFNIHSTFAISCKYETNQNVIL